MITQRLEVHLVTLQMRLMEQAANMIKQGKIAIYPTDSGYALGCKLGNKPAVEHIRKIRGLDPTHFFTLVCSDLSSLSTYAYVDNSAYRLMKSYVPGPYTFVLPATSEVPKFLQHEKRKTIGVRIPNHIVTQALLFALKAPILSVSLNTLHAYPVVDNDIIFKNFKKKVHLFIDIGACAFAPTKIIDLTI